MTTAIGFNQGRPALVDRRLAGPCHQAALLAYRSHDGAMVDGNAKPA